MADRESAHIQVGILTVSDSCFNGAAIDRSGESLKQLVESGKHISGTVVTKDILPDEYDQIKAKLLHWSDNLKLDLILTTGGTGFSLRDVTPEATKAVLEREALGMAVAMLKGSLEITPLAMLTRLTCGTRGKTLIINLPGSTKGSAECFEIAAKGIPHAVDLLRGHKKGVDKTHNTLQSEGIKSAHGSHHHQLHFPLTQAQRVETASANEYLQVSQASPVSSAYSLTTPQLMMNQKLSPSVLELNIPKTTTITPTKKPTTNFTTEVLDSPAATVTTSTTLHFWKTLLSLSEAARMDLINMVPQTSTSQPTVSASVLPLSGSTTPVMSMAPTPTYPGVFLHNKGPLAVPLSTLEKSTNVSADSNSYSSIQNLPSIVNSSVTQPIFSDSSLHYHNTAPSLLPTPAGLSRGHNVNLPHVPSSMHSFAASRRSSSAHTEQKLSLHNKVREPPGIKYAELNNNAEISLPKEETVERSCSFTLKPAFADSTTCFSTSPRISPLTTSSCRSAITCHDTMENRQHSTICTTKNCLPPTSIALSSNDLSSLQDASAMKYINTFHHGSDTKYVTQNNPLLHTASTSKVEILLEGLSDSSHLVCPRERKPVVDCPGNPVVQILLPCSKYLHTNASTVQNKCSSAATNMKTSSLRSIVRKNRTRILNILKKQNKVRKTYMKEVNMGSDSRIQHAAQSAAEADEDIDASLDIDIENEDTMNGSHHSLYLTNPEQLRDESHFQDIATDQGVELKAENIITALRCEISDKDDTYLYTQPGDNLRDVDIAALPTSRYQENSHTSKREPHLLDEIPDTEISIQSKNSDSKNYLEIHPRLSHMPAAESCEHGHTVQCPTSTLSLIAKWSASPVKGMMAIKTAKIHNIRQQGELLYVPVGKSFKEFIKEHPMIQGIYLHKGKREIKKQLAQLCRQYDVSDKMTTWRRGSEILERNCFDDYFELTETGKKEQEEVLSSRKRDQYIVNWYVWCPGHGNCRRKCGGYGACAHGCQGMQHKQDRHNCSLMVNMKLLLSDLSTWRVNITGTHVPCGSGIVWSPSVSGCKQNSQSTQNYHSVSEIAKHKHIFHPKKAAVENTRISNWRGAALATSFAPDVWSIIEASDESGVLMNPCGASSKLESNLNSISVDASTSIPTKKRISKMLSNLKRRREERMTTYKLLPGNAKNMCSLPTVNERQTVASGYECVKNSSSIGQLMNDPIIDCVFDSSNDLKYRSVYKKDTVTLSIDGVSKSISNQVSSISNKNNSSTQGQLLSTELLHFLTCSLPQNTTPTPVISSAGGVSLISHKETLPSYSNFFENTLTSESHCAMDITAVLGSPDRKNLDVSSLNLSTLSDTAVSLEILNSVDIEQPEILKIQSLKTSSCLQEDLVSSTGASVQCKETLTNSEIFPTLNFEQPFLCENTLGEILHQASSEFHYNFEEEADNSAVCMDTSLSDFGNLDNLNFSGKCQVDQSHSVGQQYSKHEQTYQQSRTSNGSQSPVLQQISSEETHKFLVPSTDPVMLDSLMELNGLLPLSENAEPIADIYPANVLTASAHASCPSLNTSQISSLSVSPHYFSHAAAEDVTEHDSSSCENLPSQMQEMLPTLPSYHEATLALAEQLGFKQSVDPL